MIKLVICDADGTLFCNEKNLWKIENSIAKSLGIFPITRQKHRYHWYKPTKERLALTYSDLRADKIFEVLMETFPAYIKKRQIDTIGDKNIKTLKKLRQSGKHLALLTSRQGGEMSHLLEGDRGLDKWFEKIYHCGNLEYSKPDPKVFDSALDYFKVQPWEAIYVGDLELDGVCAKSAGLKFIASLEEGIKTKEDFKQISVDFFAPRFPDILDYIK